MSYHAWKQMGFKSMRRWVEYGTGESLCGRLATQRCNSRPESPNASVAMGYQLYKHSPACWARQLGQTGFCFSGAGFGYVGPGFSAGTGLSAPDMDRVCKIVVIPDVVANVDALAAARTCAAVLGPERRATKRIGASIAEDLASMPQNPFGDIQKGPSDLDSLLIRDLPNGRLIDLAVVEVVVP